MRDTEWANFNSKEGLSIVLYSMSYCLLFHCFFFEHYLYDSTTWVLAFALSFFWLVSLRLSCSVICIFLQSMVVSQKEDMIFRIGIKFGIYIVVIRLFYFFGHFCLVSAPLPPWADPTEF